MLPKDTQANRMRMHLYCSMLDDVDPTARNAGIRLTTDNAGTLHLAIGGAPTRQCNFPDIFVALMDRFKW